MIEDRGDVQNNSRGKLMNKTLTLLGILVISGAMALAQSGTGAGSTLPNTGTSTTPSSTTDQSATPPSSSTTPSKSNQSATPPSSDQRGSAATGSTATS